MNLAIRGIDGQIAHGDTFHNDRHPDLKADYVLANPPFNDSDWRGELLRGDKRWVYGVPPAGNANFAWVQHFIHHLAPTGLAGFVLANGSMSSNQSGEGEIRRAIVEADLVDCMVALPGQLFYSTQIPACLWFLARDRGNGKFRDRRGQVLFVDARKLGKMVDRTHRELTDKDITRIADTYHAWRGEKGAGEYADLPGFCKSASLEDVRKHGHVLTPGRYVGAEAQEDDGEPFDKKMQRLVAQLREEQAESAKLDSAIATNLKELGYGAGYQYAHDFPEHFVVQDYLGTEKRYYEPSDQGGEKEIKERLQKWRALVAAARICWRKRVSAAQCCSRLTSFAPCSWAPHRPCASGCRR